MEDRDFDLDPDIARALTEAQRPSEADEASLERVRAKLMRRIANDSVPHHTSIHAGQGSWHALLPGIERKVLFEEGGVMSYLLKFAPGAVLPAHRHPVDEECVVISGVLRIGNLVLPPGSYHRVRHDIMDADSTSDEGAVIFLRGATPRADQLL
ncbi:MAG TPA: cupin domain-containing protein [Ramlibacter sp.]|uniref:cupin domain-containing protein n=1 Tax=Ramlibacter sp. TaxID=1917967 RepID=UPI002B508FE5|nr:cupin domain-containing protein [Ramlibacter sp.]HVZ42980.1 cupin domain-containing protein [Ramlibacter sp.]